MSEWQYCMIYMVIITHYHFELQGLVPAGQAGKNPCPREALSLMGETNNKIILY